MYLAADGDGQGHVYLLGGLSTSGSQQPADSLTTINMGAKSPTFTTSDATPIGGVYGGTITLLDDSDTLLSLGGVCANGTLQSFESLAYYSTSAKAWSTVPASGSSIPTPRRGHVSVALPNKRIFMFGGATLDMTSAMDDSWILDWRQSPPTWSQVSANGGPSARYGHSGVAYGSKVAIAFGWTANNPADTALYTFDATSMQSSSRTWSGGQWTTSYTPDPSAASTSSTGAQNGNGDNSKAGSTTASSSGSKSTKSSQNPFQSPSSGDSGSATDDGQTSAGTKAGAALGSLIGLGLIAGVGMYAYRRRQYGDRANYKYSTNIDKGGGSEGGGMVLLGGNRHYDGPDELYTLEKGYGGDDLADARRGYEPGMHPMGPRQPSRPNVAASPWSFANTGQAMESGKPQLRQKLAMLTGLSSSSPSAAAQQRFDMLADEDDEERGDAYAMHYTRDLGKHDEQLEEEDEEYYGQQVVERQIREYDYGRVDQDNWNDYDQDRINSAGPGGAAEIYGATVDRDVRHSFDENVYAEQNDRSLSGIDSNSSQNIHGVTLADSGPSSLSNSSNNVISFSEAPVRRQGGASPLIKRSPTWWDRFMGQSFLERSASGRMLPGPRADEPIRDPAAPPALDMIRESGRSANASAVSDPFADSSKPGGTQRRVGENEAAVKSAYSIASIRRMTDGYDPNAHLYVANPDKRRGSSHTTTTSSLSGRSGSHAHV
jgi:hypothetical protein